jgi:hypothetical protein
MLEPKSHIISDQEIAWVTGKYHSVLKASRRTLKEAMEIGDWFLDALERMGLDRMNKQRQKSTWTLWLDDKFPNIDREALRRFMQLAREREFLENQYLLTSSDLLAQEKPVTVYGAVAAIRTRNAQERLRSIMEMEGVKQLPDRDPGPERLLFELQELLNSYRYHFGEEQRLRAEIAERMRVAELTPLQITQAVEWATREHPELREAMLQSLKEAA